MGGSAGAYRRSPLGFLRALREQCGDLVRFRLARTPFVLLSHPHEVARVLSDPQPESRKRRASPRRTPLSEQGLTSWPLPTHGRPNRRAVLSSLLSERMLSELSDGWASASEDLADSWESQVRPGEAIDVFGEVLTHAIDLSLLAFLGIGPRTVEGDLFSQAVSTCLDQLRDEAAREPIVPGEPQRLRRRETRAALQELESLLEQKLEKRRRSPQGAPDDFLDQLVRTQTGLAPPLRERELEAELRALLIPGVEAIGSALAWTLWLLATHPAFQEEMAKEVSRVFGQGHIDYQELGALYLTRMVIDESLRLYPPTWWISRTASTEMEIAGFRIARGTRLIISPWVTQRHPDVWEDPDSFDPLRFSPARSTGRMPLSHLPFGAGPRSCPAELLVRAQLTVVLAVLVRRFQLAPEEGHVLTPVASLVLEPNEPVWIRLRPRSPQTPEA